MAVAPERLDAKLSAGRDHRRLERRHQGPHEDPAIREPKDRVGNELPRPVVGHLAPALDPDDLERAAAELPWRREDVGGIGLPAERQDGIMLEQEKLVRDAARGPLLDELLLERPGFPI